MVEGSDFWGKRDLKIARGAVANRVLLLLHAATAALAVDEYVLRLDVTVDLKDVTFCHIIDASSVHKIINTDHAAAMEEADGRQKLLHDAGDV